MKASWLLHVVGIAIYYQVGCVHICTTEQDGQTHEYQKQNHLIQFIVDIRL